MNLTFYGKLIVDLQIYFVSPCIFLIYSSDYDGNVKKKVLNLKCIRLKHCWVDRNALNQSRRMLYE